MNVLPPIFVHTSPLYYNLNLAPGSSFPVSIKLRGVEGDGRKEEGSGHLQLHSTLLKFNFLSYSLVFFAFAKT